IAYVPISDSAPFWTPPFRTDAYKTSHQHPSGQSCNVATGKRNVQLSYPQTTSRRLRSLFQPTHRRSARCTLSWSTAYLHFSDRSTPDLPSATAWTELQCRNWQTKRTSFISINNFSAAS